MTAQIKGFRSRTQLNMRKPKSVSTNINAKQGGSAAHYGGSTPNPAPSNHAQCESIWRSWQNYHMDTQGWADIAYTSGYCNHGYVLAGRGYGVRTAANGTNDANYRFYAFCWIGGGNATVSTAAKDALEWLIADARLHGKAGMAAKPHSSFYSTSCPGTTLTAHVKKFDGKPIVIKPPIPPSGGTVSKQEVIDGLKSPEGQKAIQSAVWAMVAKDTEGNPQDVTTLNFLRWTHGNTVALYDGTKPDKT